MERRIVVVKGYQREFENPISMKKGATITVIKRNDGKYKEWYWCRTDDGAEAYVHEKFLEVNDSMAKFLEDYNSAELSVSKGDILISLYNVGGWILAKKSTGEQGWIPEENSEPYNSL